jgi:proline iminopeptidase
VHAFVERIATGEPPDLSALDSFNAQVDSFDLRPDLPRIDAPALVVYGTGELERAGEDDLIAGLPNARLTLIGDAGHFPWVEQPERFREAVLDFLSE